jgi:diguanylate cyclase (GGDEF)-like protein
MKGAGFRLTAAAALFACLLLGSLTTTPTANAAITAAGLLFVIALGDRFRLRLERSLAEERTRARLDSLTGAPNRYALEEALRSEQARIGRGGRTAALCFLDLDRFKTVNDSFGYEVGDALLVDVYKRLREGLRTSDQVFRWGGEEFVVLALHIERPELCEFAERLRLLVSSRLFSVDGQPRPVTASVGGVVLDKTRPAEAALEAAGRLVGQAKLTRDTVVVDEAPLSPPSLGEAAEACAAG